MSVAQPLPLAGDTKRSILVGLQHTLRAPVSAIVSCSERLLNVAEEDTDELAKIRDAAAELVLQVYDLSKREHLDAATFAGDLEEFVRTLKRELTTAMHVVLGYCELAREKQAARPEDTMTRSALERIDALERIVEATERLLETVDTVSVPGVPCGAASPQPPAPVAVLPELHAVALVVDDDKLSSAIVARHLEHLGVRSTVVHDGQQALELLAVQSFDLMILDIVMPGMDGLEVLERMRDIEHMRDIPTLVVSSVDDLDTVARCIELGADDHLPKNFNRVLFDARVRAVLERKRLMDDAKVHTEQLRLERLHADELLANVLPNDIAERLKLGETNIADGFECVTVTFCDIVGFTDFSARTPPRELVARLNSVVVAFDKLVEHYGVEKLKTIGDCYMMVSGVPRPRDDHASAAARCALAMMKKLHEHNARYDEPLQMRVGMHSGPVVGGVIGRKRLVYDVWGDTVNLASRMESNGVRGRIQVSQATHDLLGSEFPMELRGEIPLRGRGRMRAYLLSDPLNDSR